MVVLVALPCQPAGLSLVPRTAALRRGCPEHREREDRGSSSVPGRDLRKHEAGGLPVGTPGTGEGPCQRGRCHRAQRHS